VGVVNNFYRSVWNEAIGAWVAVSEIASIRGKRSSGLRRAGGRSAEASPEQPGRAAFSLQPVCAALLMAGFVSGLMVLSPTARAADVTWTGASNQNWSDGTNWDGGLTPLSGDNAILNDSNGAVTATLSGANLPVGSVELQGNATLNVSGAATLGVVGNILMGTAASPAQSTLSIDGSTVDAGSLTVGSAAGSSGLVDVSAGSTLNVSGPALVGDSGTGTMTIGGGSQVIIGDGATSTLFVGSSTGGIGTLNIGDSIGAGTLAAGTVNLGNVSSSIVFDLEGTFNTTFAPAISGSGYIVKDGTGTLALNAASSYSGGTTLNSGQISVGNDSALGTGVVRVSGASTISGSAALANDVQLSASVTLQSTALGDALTLNGVISGAGGLTKEGAGSLTLTGNNTYMGTTSLNSGTLFVGSNTALGTGTLLASDGTILDASTATTLANSAFLGGNVTFGGTNALTLNGVIIGTGGLTKLGAADLTLNGDNSYLGDTELNAGKLIVGSDNALGLGALNAASGTELDADAPVSLSNHVLLGGLLTIDGTNDLTLDGTIVGSGLLVKNGSANLTLNGANTFLGFVNLNAGTLTLGSAAALGNIANELTVGSASTLDNSVALVGPDIVNNPVALNANLSIAGTHDLGLGGVIDGAGGLIKNGAATLTLTGANTFTGGITLNGGALSINAAVALGTGALTVDSASILDNLTGMTTDNDLRLNADLSISGNSNLVLVGNISGTGGLLKNGAAVLALEGNNTFTGTLNIMAGSVTAIDNGALGNASLVAIGSGASLDLEGDAGVGGLVGNGTVQIALNSMLTVGGGNNSSSFDGALEGVGALIKAGVGTLSLNGVNSFTGTTLVSRGILNVAGSLASGIVEVGTGGTLSGNGSLLGALTVDNGGHLGLSSGNTMSVGSLVMNSGSNLDVALAAPSTNAVLNVGGDLTLDGQLNASDAGGFGVGVYRLINYTGALTDHGLDVGAAPIGYNTADLQVQISVANQVNLLVGASTANIRFWDGSQTSSNGAVDGGSGTWDASSTNWTSVDGSQNQTWASDFAIFQGAAGDITVNGTETIDGMQFVTDGDKLLAGTAAQLTIVNGGTGNTAIRVDPGSTATIDVNIDGSGTLNKLDSGTLVLDGANSYTGGTLLNGGTLVVGNASALGTGTLTAAAGTTLANTDSVNLHNDIDLAGDLTVDGSNTLTLDGAINGAGGLIKTGSGNLILTGVNTYSGATSVNAGTLSVNSAITSAVTVNSGGTLGGIGAVGGLNVMSGGVVAPGNGLGNANGALAVNGNATFAAGSSYRVVVNESGQSGRIDVNGNVTLSGGTVDVQAEGGTYANNMLYNILTDTGTLSGTFAGVTSNIAFLTPTLVYGPNSVVLSMARNGVSFADVANTSNQHAISSTLDIASGAGVGGVSSDMQTVLTAVTGLSAQQARGAYDAMSGVGLNAMHRAAPAFTTNFGNQLRARLNAVGASASASASADSSNVIQLAANDRIDDLMPALAQTDVPRPAFSLGGDGIPQMQAATDTRGFWLRAYGADQSTHGDGNAAGNRIQDAGLSAGIDTKVGDNVVIGAALTHGGANINTDNNESGHTSGNAAALYASYASGAWNVNGSATLARNGNSMDRRIVFGSIDRTAHSDFDSNTVALYGDVTYDVAMNNWTLQPLAGLSLSRSKSDGFNETGADALDLQVAEQTIHSTKTLLGTKAIFDFDKVELQPRMIWEHEFGDANSATIEQLQGAPTPFSTSGVRLPRDAIVAGMTVVGHASERMSLFADVQGEFNSQQSNLALLVGLRASW
jgi:fibronectin-binding autotransporter adhesin